MDSINTAPSRRRSLGRQSPGEIARRLRVSGFEDAPALTVKALDGAHPRGRELSIAWLAGTVMTGLTSVLLMGAALYVSFQGQDNYSTASEALQFTRSSVAAIASVNEKGNRLRPVAKTLSDEQVIDASVQVVEGGRTVIRSQQFVRMNATLAMSATPLAEDIPVFDPVALAATIEESSPQGAAPVAAQVYAANVEGEVAITAAAMPATFVPARAIDDATASQFARASMQEGLFEDGPDPMFAYAPPSPGFNDLGILEQPMGVVENMTVMPKSLPPSEGTGRSERIVTVRTSSPLEDVLLKNGFTPTTAGMVIRTLGNVMPTTTLPAEAKLRILMGPSRTSSTAIPYRLSIYLHDAASGAVKHAATAALTDRGGYVIGLAPSEMEFPEEDTEATDVTALPTLYRSLWETARKHELDDATTTRLLAMFAYEVDLNQKVTPGDKIQLLTTGTESGKTELMYAALQTGATTRELFRFQNPDGSVSYYGPEGDTGKRFLIRRPVQGGGRRAAGTARASTPSTRRGATIPGSIWRRRAAPPSMPAATAWWPWPAGMAATAGLSRSTT